MTGRAPPLPPRRTSCAASNYMHCPARARQRHKKVVRSNCILGWNGTRAIAFQPTSRTPSWLALNITKLSQNPPNVPPCTRQGRPAPMARSLMAHPAPPAARTAASAQLPPFASPAYRPPCSVATLRAVSTCICTLSLSLNTARITSCTPLIPPFCILIPYLAPPHRSHA